MTLFDPSSPPSRILFVTAAPPDGLAGGVKVMHRHAELLVGLGIDARVLAPRGAPVWFRSQAVMETTGLRVRPGDLLVFGEEMDAAYQAALALPCWRALYCQNHHYLLHERLGGRNLAEAGFHRTIAASGIIQRFLSEVMEWPGADLVVPPIDPALFRPAANKQLCIALMPRKLPEQAAFIHAVFCRRHPDLASVPWVTIAGRHEEEVAEILAGSAVFLSLAHREGLGMVALEAMASGCAVVGFHGVGGLDYATAENGRWFWHEEALACADALADVVRRIEHGDPAVTAMIAAGQATAAAYAPAQVARQLRACYGEGGTCGS